MLAILLVVTSRKFVFFSGRYCSFQFHHVMLDLICFDHHHLLVSGYLVNVTDEQT